KSNSLPKIGQKRRAKAGLFLFWECPSFGSTGWVRRRRAIHVEKPSMGSVAGSITVAVAVIRFGAPRRKFFAARRLRELPDRGVADPACRRGRRIRWERAAGRWWAGVVVCPSDDIV